MNVPSTGQEGSVPHSCMRHPFALSLCQQAQRHTEWLLTASASAPSTGQYGILISYRAVWRVTAGLQYARCSRCGRAGVCCAGH
eukprot:15657-Heterococcus_DN1.PRE.2